MPSQPDDDEPISSPGLPQPARDSTRASASESTVPAGSESCPGRRDPEYRFLQRAGRQCRDDLILGAGDHVAERGAVEVSDQQSRIPILDGFGDQGSGAVAGVEDLSTVAGKERLVPRRGVPRVVITPFFGEPDVRVQGDMSLGVQAHVSVSGWVLWYRFVGGVDRVCGVLEPVGEAVDGDDGAPFGEGVVAGEDGRALLIAA